MRLISAASSVSLRQVIEQVNQDADYTLIAGEDASGAVVMSLDTFNSLMETVYLLSSQANAAHLQRSIEQDRRGERFQRDLVDA